MANPSHKDTAIEAFLEKHYGRTTAITSDVCIRKPTGCEGPATEFKDELAKSEYALSGLCQKCQDKVFGKG